MKSDMENRDWLNDYMSLKQVNPVTPFTVPDNYFDELGDRIVSYKNIDALKNNGVNGGFTVPENYFETLTGNIQSRVNIENAVNAESHGFTVPDDYFDVQEQQIGGKIFLEETLGAPVESFVVPEGYFDNLQQQINSRIFLEETLGEPVEGFTVPEGYFDNLEQQVNSRIFIEETLAEPAEGFIVPEGYFDNLQQQINNRIFIEEALGEPAESFAVPEGYFNKLNKTILDKTVNIKIAKNKGIVRKLYTSTAFKYATAACFALAIGGGILINQLSDSGTDHQKTFLHRQLSNVPVDDIKAYLQLNVDAGDTQQTVATEGVPVDESSLKNALQNDADSLQ